MSTAAHETSLGVDHRKLAMWVFLGSEFLFFGAFISAYLLYFRETNGGPGVELFDIAFTSISSFILLMSSLTMVLAHNAHASRDMRRTRLWLYATAMLGLVFIGGQAFEFTVFYQEGLWLVPTEVGATGSPMASAFFVLTGLHGAHVTIGIIMLLSTAALTRTGKIKPDQDVKVEMVGLYWHFVDIVWVLIFTVVYLIPYDLVVFGG